MAIHGGVVAERGERVLDAMGLRAPRGHGPAHRFAQAPGAIQAEPKLPRRADHFDTTDVVGRHDRRAAQHRLDTDQAEGFIL